MTGTGSWRPEQRTSRAAMVAVANDCYDMFAAARAQCPLREALPVPGERHDNQEQ
jgi:hypothetical protein